VCKACSAHGPIAVEGQAKPCVGGGRSLLYQSVFNNTLVDHAYTNIHDQKNKSLSKKKLYNNAILLA